MDSAWRVAILELLRSYPGESKMEPRDRNTDPNYFRASISGLP